MSAALRARIAEAVAGGFTGSVGEMATRLGCGAKAVYDARQRGASWPLPEPPSPVGSRFSDWTVREVAPMLNGQTRWRVQCVCGVVVTRYAADIVAGRSTRCPLPREEHGLLIERRRARSVRCPTCGKARACVGVFDLAGWEYGVHVERARLAGCAPMVLPVEDVTRWVSTSADGDAARLADVRRGLLRALRRHPGEGG